MLGESPASQRRGRMRKQLLGSLLVFFAIAGVATFASPDPDLQGLEGGRRALWRAIQGVAYAVSFGLLFAGLRVFAAGLRHRSGPRPAAYHASRWTPPPRRGTIRAPH